MKNILILGSLPKNNEEKQLYELITSVCKEFARFVNSPIDTAQFTGTERERYDRHLKQLKKLI